MFYYLKPLGDEPIVIRSENKISFDKEYIQAEAKDVYFLVSVMTSQGPGQTPVSAEENGLKNCILTFNTKNISMITELKDSEIPEIISKLNLKKSGIIIPDKKLV